MTPDEFLALVSRLPESVTEFSAGEFYVRVERLPLVPKAEVPTVDMTGVKVQPKTAALSDVSGVTAVPPPFNEDN